MQNGTASPISSSMLYVAIVIPKRAFKDAAAEEQFLVLHVLTGSAGQSGKPLKVCPQEMYGGEGCTVRSISALAAYASHR